MENGIWTQFCLFPKFVLFSLFTVLQKGQNCQVLFRGNRRHCRIDKWVCLMPHGDFFPKLLLKGFEGIKICPAFCMPQNIPEIKCYQRVKDLSSNFFFWWHFIAKIRRNCFLPGQSKERTKGIQFRDIIMNSYRGNIKKIYSQKSS